MTITQQQIIALAVEAGFNVGKDAGGDYVAPKYGDSLATLERLVKAAYQRGVRDERDRSADALVAEGVAEYERGLKDGAKLERNACLAEIETGIWMDKTTEEVLFEIAEAIRARGEACRLCKGTGERDSGGSQPWGEPITVQCECQDSRNGLRDVRDEWDARNVVFDDQQNQAARLSQEWAPCVKLPVTVHVREQRHGETHVSTREGITPILPSDLIMRGVMGEEYPIGRELFYQTYRLGEYSAKPETLTCIAAEREACAITAWNHYMDECRKKNVHPADFGEWCAASAIRASSDE